jgi:hypothetical protein
MTMLLALALTTAAAGDFQGTLKDFGLDQAGGLGGAPEGMVFVLPPGASATATFGPLGDGADGVRLAVTQPGDALVCTQPLPLGPQAFFRARARVPEITAGNGSWMGMNVELRARDGMGGLVGQYVMIKNVREPMGWQDIDQRLPVPAGSTQGEFCFRFVLSTGVVEIDKISVVSKIDGSAPVAPPPAPVVSATPAPASAPAAPTPAAPAPAPTALFSTKKTKELTPVAVVAASPPPSAAPPPATVVGTSNNGFTLRLDLRGSSVGCSRWLPTVPSLHVSGTAALSVVNPDAAGWSGLAVEGYARDAQGRPMLVGGAPWAPLYVTTTAGPEQQFSLDWVPPAGAVRVRVCGRFADAAGNIDFEL